MVMKSASEYCKSAGLKSLAEVARRTKTHKSKLYRWFHDNPELFAIVVDGCVWRRELEKRK